MFLTLPVNLYLNSPSNSKPLGTFLLENTVLRHLTVTHIKKKIYNEVYCKFSVINKLFSTVKLGIICIWILHSTYLHSTY